MNIKIQLWENWRSKAVAAGTIALLGVAFLLLPIFQGLSHFSYDLPFAFRIEDQPDEVVIVFMDDESRTRLQQPVQGPWDRALHIELLNGLITRHAKAVVLDVLFDEPWPRKDVDERLAQVIQAHGRVVLGASCQYSVEPGKPIVGRLKHAVEPLGSAASWGVAELPVDTDGTIRRQFFDEQYTNLAWQAAAVARSALADREQPRWINYYGPAGAIRHVSYFQVLSNDVSLEAISNRVVFVGMAPIINYQGSRSSDEYRTPFTRWSGASSPGVEIQATACLNLIRGDALSRLPLLAELAVTLVCAMGVGFFLPLFRPIPALMVGIGLSLLAPILATLMALHFHHWFSWAVISFVEVPAGMVWFAVDVLNRRSKSPSREAALGASVATGHGLPQIPDHEMLHPFGKGSYGQVWLAKNVFGTYRAVKVVFRAAFRSDGPFDQEFRGIQAFEPVSRSHEGFVDILQVGRRDEAGYFFYVMELADDQETGVVITPDQYTPRTLSNEIARRGRIPGEESMAIAVCLAGALVELHKSDLLHRDIKPSNIIFVGGTAKLADIGLVTATTDAKSFVGTEGFIPPEGPGSPQADIYSLGKVFYEMVMGRDRCRFPELPTVLPGGSEEKLLTDFNKIILRACEDDRRRRYASAAVMLMDLKRMATRIKAGRNKRL